MIRGNKTTSDLDWIAPLAAGDDAPKVSIVIPACNEETNIEAALTSVLKQDYPDYEIIVVNDRSTDRTGGILAAMVRRYPSLRLVTINSLPPGWLGKNNALEVGASHATGSLLLFTDADIVMDPSVLSRAVHFLMDRQLDHIAIAPRAVLPGFLANAVLGAFAFLFSQHLKPWKAKDPKSSHFIGIGAFNLLRTEVYRTLGGHTRIAMRPDDDIMLGKLLKTSGFKQDLVLGAKLLSVEWYASFGDMVRGLTKNMFAGIDYSVPMVLFTLVVLPLTAVWPFVALFVTNGWLLFWNASVVSIVLIGFAANSTRVGMPRAYGLAFPLGILLFLYILLRSTVVTLWTGGITWRGTHYPLALLRANKI